MKRLFFLITFAVILFFTTLCHAKQMNILVHPFENTGDKEYSWISAGMTDTVISDLTHIQNISVVSNQDRTKVLEEMKFVFSGLVEEDKMIKLGKLTGANVIFTGSYLVSGNRIRVHARLVNVETGKVGSSIKIDGSLNGIFDLQDKVVFTLMGETKKINIANIEPVNLTEQDKKKIEEKPRPNVTAYEWYAKGLEIRDTNPQEALNNYKKALDIDPNYTDALIEAGSTIGSTLNLFSEAIEYLEKAERIFKGRNETKSSDYAKIMMTIGRVYNSKGQLDRALEYCLNSQSIFDRLGLKNTADYAYLILGIGSVYHNKGQPDRALEYYLNSQSIFDRLGLQNTASYAILICNIGIFYGGKKQLDRALEYFLNSQSVYNRLGLQNTASYAKLMEIISFYYGSKGQLDRALEYSLNSQAIYDRLELQNTASYAHLMMTIGKVYNSKGQLDRGLEYSLNSKSIFDRLGLHNTASYAGLIADMARFYEDKGQRDMAGKYYRMAYDTYMRSEYSGESRDKALNNARRLGY